MRIKAVGAVAGMAGVAGVAAAAGPDDRRRPRALTDHGLAAALGKLLETVQRPTRLKAADLPRLPARVEACVYSCLATLLHGWPSGETRVLISVSARDGRLRVILFDPEATDFAHIATAAGWEVVVNRVAALGGTLASSPNFGGLIITLDVPAAEPA